MAAGTRVLQLGVPTLLAASGLLLVAASRERWGAACPPWESYETRACLERQDHLYDFFLPDEPWVPLGDAATLAGAALLVLAVAAVGVPALMLGGARSTRHAVVGSVSAAVPAASLLVVGWATLRAGGTGVTAPDSWVADAPEVGWMLGWPVALVTLATIAGAAGLRGGAWRWLTVCLLGAGTPLGLLFLGPVLTGYLSHDTAPWTEASAGVLLVLAAPALWRAGVAGRQHPVADRGERRPLEVPRTERRLPS